VKLKSFAILALIVLGCGAAYAQKSYSAGFLGYDGKTLYCDYEQLTITGQFAAGVHNLSKCFTDNEGNGVMVGVATANLGTSSGSPVTGSAYAFADNSVEVGYNGGFACGCAVLYITKLQPNEQAYGWELYYSFYPGYEYLGTYGYLTKQLGGSNPNDGTYDVVR